MEGSFDQELLVFTKRPRNLPKMKPSRMSRIQKRLHDSIQHRRSTRWSGFDQCRDIQHEINPLPIKEVHNEAQLKTEHRRQQLEKWKLEKAQKKKEEAMLKKKPFITGIPHAPTKYVVPPPPPKTAPSTSGRVTRSITRKATETRAVTNKVIEKKAEQQSAATALAKHFGLKVAPFKPPKLNNTITLPLKFNSRNKSKTKITFDPIVHPKRTNASSSVSSSESSSTMLNDNKPRRKFVQTPIRFAKDITTSSSDSDLLTNADVKRNNFKNKALRCKGPIVMQTSSDTDSASTSNKTEAKQTKKVAQTKPAPRKVAVTRTEPNQIVNESPKLAKRPTRAAKLNALTSIEQYQANKHKTLKVVLSKVKLSPKVVIEPLVLEQNSQETSKAAPSQIKRDKIKTSSSRIVTPKRPIPKSESSSEERMKVTPKNSSLTTVLTTPSTLDSSGSAENTSPFVCMSRGKDNARREMMRKAKEGLLGAELEKGEDSVSYFRQLLDSETQRISLVCNSWDSIYEETELPEFVQGIVISAVGQGRLLVAQKFRQFLSLIDRCASAEDTFETVTVSDLRGFWDMIYIQVKNIDMRFAELEDLRLRNWSQEPLQPQQTSGHLAKKSGDLNKKSGEPAKKKAATKGRKSKVTAGPSKIREMIAAARKAKQQQDSDISFTSSTISSTTTLTAVPVEEKTFNAGFFSVRSPVRSPSAPNTPVANKSLLKTVLSSEARKASRSSSKMNTPYAMLRASLFGKNMDIEGVSPLEQTPKPIPINLNATPARSILKSGKKQSHKKSNKKLNKTVLFDQQDSDDSISENMSLANDNEKATGDWEKENTYTVLSSTDSVQIIESSNKSSRKSNEVLKSGRKSIENVNSGRQSDHNDTVVSTRSGQKTKSTGKPTLQRQNATITSPIMTRLQRKSLQPFLVDDITPEATVLKELVNIAPSRVSRRTTMFDISTDYFEVSGNPTPRRSKRLTKISSEEDDLIQFDSPVKIPARSSKRRAVN